MIKGTGKSLLIIKVVWWIRVRLHDGQPGWLGHLCLGFGIKICGTNYG